MFGLELALPIRGNDDDPDGRHAAKAVLVRLVDDLPAVNLHGHCSVGLDSPALSESTAPVVCPTLCPLRSSNPIASLPLCDSARFERSGVLRSVIILRNGDCCSS